MKSIRTDPRNHAPEGDERIRTAVPAPGADPVYECPCVRRSVAALEANVDEKYRTADAYANAIAVGALNCRCKAEILDACCGGRQWWWDKNHPLAVYMDKRIAPPGSVDVRPNWSCEPDVQADFRAMPFADESFRLVLFDPPHIVREQPSGYTAMKYGALAPDTEQDDLRAGFSECWRVLAPGGTLVFKWAGDLERVKPHFPATPIVGNRLVRKSSGLGTRWIIFYKQEGAA